MAEMSNKEVTWSGKEDHETCQKEEGVLCSQTQQADRCAEELEQFDQTCDRETQRCTDDACRDVREAVLGT